MKVLLNFFTPFYWDSESLFAISSRLHQKSVAGPQTGPGLLTTTISRWWNNRICRGKKIYCYFNYQDVSWSRPNFLRPQRGDVFLTTSRMLHLILFLRNVAFYSWRFTRLWNPPRSWFTLCSRPCTWSLFGYILGSTWQGWHTFRKLGESLAFIFLSIILGWQKVTITRSPNPFCCCRQFLFF